MSSADLATVVITCPHCGTRYQVPPATIGADGRDVQCAHCGRNWHAKAEATPPPPPPPKPALRAVAPAPKPDSDALFSPGEEAALDDAFESAAEAASPPRPPEAASGEPPAAARPPGAAANDMDAATINAAMSSFNRRQQALLAGLPLARVRRLARLISGATLVVFLGVVIGFRADFVRGFPSLAGLYGAIGLPVNVVGLTFEDTKTLLSLRNGKTVMQISAKLRSVGGGTVRVPPVTVSLLSDAGAVLYEWTVAPDIVEMEPGEVQDFSTEVNAPPAGATRVRLSFTTKV